MVFNLRQQLFDQLLRLPTEYFDANAQGHIVSRITFTVTQLRDTSTDAIRAVVQDGLKGNRLVGLYAGFELAPNLDFYCGRRHCSHLWLYLPAVGFDV